MTRSVLPEHAINGGFPEPPADEPIHVIAARHAACGEATRVRLPGSVPAFAVRRLRCSACDQAYETERVEELGFEEPGQPLGEDPARDFAPGFAAAAIAEPEPEAPAASARSFHAATVDELLAELASVEAELGAEAEPAESSAAAEPAAEIAPAAVPYDYTSDEVTREVAVVKEARRRLSPPKLAKPRLPKLSLPKLTAPKLTRSGPSRPDAKPKLALPKLNPQSKTWRLASLPVAAALVVGALLLLQGGSGDGGEDGRGGSVAKANGKAGKQAATPPPTDPTAIEGAKKTKLVRGSSYSLALPAGWEQINPPGGATFAAVSDDLGADATLWIEEDPKLDFPTFINQSMAQLEALAGSARIVERVPAPTAEATIVRLAADAPPGQPTYEVTLRAAGPYRYYLATSVQPDAAREAVQGAELVAGSFTPEGSR